jgi:class 3 adenylate cyclase
MTSGFAKCLGILLLAGPISAAGAFFFRGEATFPVLEEEISYRVDGASSFEKVLADREGWVSQRERPFRGSRDPVRIWAKFDVPPAPEARRIFLRTGPWESVEYFFVRDGQLVDRQRAGTLLPWEERMQVTMTPASFHAGFVAMDLPPRTGEAVYARLATDNRFLSVTRLRFSLWDANFVLEGERRDRYFQGAFLGVMLALVLYNVALFLLDIRESSYLYYSISLVGNTFVQAMMFGLTLEFLWPDHPAWDYYCMWIAIPLGLWAFVQFGRGYLDTRRHFPGFDVSLKWAGYAALMLLPMDLLPFAADHPINLIFTLMGTVLVTAAIMALVVGATVLALMKRRPQARIFLVAMLCTGIGVFITCGSWFGLFPEVEWALNASQVATSLTGILLSIGLGFRMRQLRTELADKQIEEARRQGVHEREKRELIEEQSRGLEAKVQERTAELVATRQQSDALLANILPRAIIEELKANGQSEPRRHEEASILFTDFSGFTQTVATIPAKRLVHELDEIFRGFDDIITEHGVEKMKTIGDAYMAAGGLPVPAGDHAVRCVRAALELTRFIEARNKASALKWGLRVGVHSGAVVAGIVGKSKYAYDVWGDTVNIASRLESAGEINRVNISAYTFELVREFFECEYRGKLAAKGKGEMEMYFVLRERAV